MNLLINKNTTKKHYKNISLVQIEKQFLSILFWLRDPFSIFFFFTNFDYVFFIYLIVTVKISFLNYAVFKTSV